MFVPIAPSYTSTRRFNSLRYRDSIFLSVMLGSRPRRAITKKPAHKRWASALAVYLTWPQVALNRHGVPFVYLTIVVRVKGRGKVEGPKSVRTALRIQGFGLTASPNCGLIEGSGPTAEGGYRHRPKSSCPPWNDCQNPAPHRH